MFVSNADKIMLDPVVSVTKYQGVFFFFCKHKELPRAACAGAPLLHLSSELWRWRPCSELTGLLTQFTVFPPSASVPAG